MDDGGAQHSTPVRILTTRVLAPLLACLAMIAPFSIDTMFPAFHLIAGEFDISMVAMQQTLSVYLGAFAFMSLFHGAVSDSFGRRKVLLSNLLVFALSSIGCALAPNLVILLLFRVLQGFSSGAGSVVGRAIIRDCFEGPEATKLMSQVTLIFGVAPAIAPIFGGWVLGFSGWRTIFWVLAVFAVVLAGWSHWLLPETHPPARRIEFSPRQLMHSYREVFGDPICMCLAGAISFSYGAFFLFVASAPNIVLKWLHLNEQQFAWLFIPTIGGIMVGAFISGKMAGVYSASRVVLTGFAVSLGGCVIGALNAWLASPSIPWTLIQPFMVSLGGALMSPTSVLLMMDRFPEIRGTVASVQTATVLTSNALVAGVLSPLVSANPRELVIAAIALNLAGMVCWAGYQLQIRRSTTASSAPSAGV